MVAVASGAGTTLLNLTGGEPASSAAASVLHQPTSRQFPAPPAAKPQHATSQASSSVPQPSQQPQSVVSFQPRLAFGQQTRPSLQTSFGGQAFSVTKQKDAVDLSKHQQRFTSVPSSTFPAAGNQKSLISQLHLW